MELEIIPYPKSVYFIIVNEFCERFTFYGIRGILTLYIRNMLQYSEPDTKVIFHVFSMFVFIFPLIGAIISDSWWGKFRTVFYISLIYVVGCVLLSLAATDPIFLPQRPVALVALMLIAMGTGGIKPCISAFGGDQFVLPQQQQELATFFSLFYLSINVGSLMATFLMPLLRSGVYCFGKHSCYSLAFAFPTVMMILAVVVFVVGKPWHKIMEPKGNVFLNVVKCISHAVVKRNNGTSVNHWLDRAEPQYGAQLVSDVKLLLRVLVLYIPVPVFWTLFEQQASGWTLQAVRMDGYIGFYTILPDQMQIANSMLIIIFIPLFAYVIYPSFAKCHLLRTPLQRMCCGGFLAAVSFIVSAFVAMRLEKTYPKLPVAREAQIRIYDATTCEYSFTSSNHIIPFGILKNGYYQHRRIQVPKPQTVALEFTPSNSSCQNLNYTLTMKEKTAYGLYITKNLVKSYEDNVDKSHDGYPLVRTIVNDEREVTYIHIKTNSKVKVEAGNVKLLSMPQVGDYRITNLNDQKMEFRLGATYTIVIKDDQTMRTVVVTEPNTVHMLWLLPQYIIITAAEIMFSITGLDLSYSQAPVSMKSVVQACYLLTFAVGNFLIVVVETMRIFDTQSSNFFLYAFLMVGDMMLFTYLSIRYKYVDHAENE